MIFPDFATKHETGTNVGIPPPGMAITKPSTTRSPTTTPTWSRLKDPRIVCMSRAFGGKDRHSKVCTVRGIRDRRVRLSVPTAIKLYDLQDRLGLNQPSKVVDWLLNAAKHGIDELPPLDIPEGCFAQMINSHCPRENPNFGESPMRNVPKLDVVDLGITGKPLSGIAQMVNSHHENPNFRDSPWNDTKNPKLNPGVDLWKIGSDKQAEACFQVSGMESNSMSREMACFQVPGLYNSILRFDSPNLTTQPDHDLQNFGMPPVIVCQPGMATQPSFQPSHQPGSDNTNFIPKQSNLLGFSSEVPNASLIPSLVHCFGIQSALRTTMPFDMTDNLPTLKKDEQNMKNKLINA